MAISWLQENHAILPILYKRDLDCKESPQEVPPVYRHSSTLSQTLSLSLWPIPGFLQMATIFFSCYMYPSMTPSGSLRIRYSPSLTAKYPAGGSMKSPVFSLAVAQQLGQNLAVSEVRLSRCPHSKQRHTPMPMVGVLTTDTHPLCSSRNPPPNILVVVIRSCIRNAGKTTCPSRRQTLSRSGHTSRNPNHGNPRIGPGIAHAPDARS